MSNQTNEFEIQFEFEITASDDSCNVILAGVSDTIGSWPDFSSANDDPNFSERVRENGIVKDTESILLSSNVYFYPNKNGFGLLSGGGKRTKAYIVFTENGYAVVDWSRKQKAYEVVHQETPHS